MVTENVEKGDNGNKKTYKTETYPSGEQVTILQLQGSTELESQFSRTLWGSNKSYFMAINATTVKIEIEIPIKN